MIKKTYRKLNEFEVQVLQKLLECPFPGRDELRQQIKNCKVRTLTEYKDNYGSIEFKDVLGEEAIVKERVPVEGRTKDGGGGPILILLHIIKGKIDELEFVRMDGAPMQGSPNIDTMEVIIR